MIAIKDEDCVSRQAVFETIDDCNSDGLKGIFCSYDDGERFKEYIKKLPPVTPTHGICDDCVSRAELKKWLDMNFSFGGALRKLEMFDRIDKELPPVTPTHGTCKDCKYIYCEHHEETCDIDEYNPNFSCAYFEKRGSEE